MLRGHSKEHSTVTLSDVLAAVSVRFEEGKQRIERANGKECERGHGGWGYDNFITTCDFILNSQCAKIVWRPDCALTRKEILSIPLDSQSHSGRPEKKQSLTPLAAVMGVLRLGMDGEGGRTGIGKENRKEEINFILNNY